MIEFKVSSLVQVPYSAHLVRIAYADPNPTGPGLAEFDLQEVFSGTYPSRSQPVHIGSYGKTVAGDEMACHRHLTIIANIWPTQIAARKQAILSIFSRTGLTLDFGLNGARGLYAEFAGSADPLELDIAIRQRMWHRVWLSLDLEAKRATLGCCLLEGSYDSRSAYMAACNDDALLAFGNETTFCIGAKVVGKVAERCYNGKIEAPQILSGPWTPEMVSMHDMYANHPDTIVHWDFSKCISSLRFCDQGPYRLHGEFVNAPARGMTGANWNGDTMCWTASPEHYGAVHFHEDDLYDCKWETDFSLRIPGDLKSGCYGIRLTVGNCEDVIPFYVVPAATSVRNRIAVLIPTFTYMAYGNHARGATNDEYLQRARTWGAREYTPDSVPQFGLSTYNKHRDGSGISYASRLRPLLNFRPNFLTFVGPCCGSGVHHYGADFYLTSWLEKMGFEYDIVTDEELDREGLDSVSPYEVVITTSHPEYHTLASLNAMRDFLSEGGKLMYLGGNGFYWRVATNEQIPGLIEIRRNETGIRAWATSPGEYYHSLDGSYGGLWRSNGRPPQHLVGIGFSAQGAFAGGPYFRTEVSYEPDVISLFDGIEGVRIGDYGFAGGGAAGYELDRVEAHLGTPSDAKIIARSVSPHSSLEVVPEDILWKNHTLTGESIENMARADMLILETPGNGAVFSVGSITYTGSLPINNYDNDISRLTENVLRRFLRMQPRLASKAAQT